MRLLVLMFVVGVFLFTSRFAFGQQEPGTKSDTQSTSGAADKDSMWDALLNILDANKSVISYGDVNRTVLEKFECKDEYNRSYANVKSNDKVSKFHAVKSRCRNGVTINYSGPDDYGIGDENFNYDLNASWFPSKDRCFRASVVLKSLSDRGWTGVDVGVSAELGPDSETLKSISGNFFINVAWVPEESPVQLSNVDPSKGCFLGAQISNH